MSSKMASSPAADKAFIEQLVRLIDRHQLTGLALFLLDLGRPLTFLGGQLLWVAQPALRPFVAPNSIAQLAQLLESQAAVDQLAAQLEQRRTETTNR